MMPTTQIYRQTTVGTCLVDVLDELIGASVIDPKTAVTILEQVSTIQTRTPRHAWETILSNTLSFKVRSHCPRSINQPSKTIRGTLQGGGQFVQVCRRSMALGAETKVRDHFDEDVRRERGRVERGYKVGSTVKNRLCTFTQTTF
jgi:hypothetical protein